MNDTAILIDTNIILDWLLLREPFYIQAKEIIECCIRDEIQGCLASHTLLNIFFITRKDKTVEERKEIIFMLCDNFNIIEVDKQMIITALKNKAWDDLEDGLQIQCAIKEKVNYIITRDPKGFLSSQIQVFSPGEFIQLKNKGSI